MSEYSRSGFNDAMIDGAVKAPPGATVDPSKTDATDVRVLLKDLRDSAAFREDTRQLTRTAVQMQTETLQPPRTYLVTGVSGGNVVVVAATTTDLEPSAVQLTTPPTRGAYDRASMVFTPDSDGVALSDDTPLMNGTASAGTSDEAARADHVHPTDTSRAPLASPALTGTPTVPTPSAGDSSNQAANTSWVTGEIATAVTSVYRAAGDWDASVGTFPTTGTGPSGGIRRGDTYNVTVAGTMGGLAYDVGDAFYAKQATPGQTAGNWARFETNTEQATESTRGTGKVVTQATIQTLGTTNDADFVTAKKWWQAWSWALSNYAMAAYTIGTNAAISASDTLMQMLGKLQAQVTAAFSRSNHTGMQAISTVTNLQAELDARHTVNLVTLPNTNTTLAATARVIKTSTGHNAPIVVTLPPANSTPQIDFLIIADLPQLITTTNTVTIQAAGSDTLNGVTAGTVVMQKAGGSLLLVCDGSAGWSFNTSQLRAENNLSDVLDAATALANLAGAKTANVQQIANTATTTVTIPSGSKRVQVFAVGAGGGGGAGACVASGTASSGGAGGGGGAVSERWFNSLSGGVYDCAIGAGGSSPAGRNTAGNGTSGGTGGDTTFGLSGVVWVRAGGGGGGLGGRSSAAATAGTAGVGQFNGGLGAAGTSGAAGTNGPTTTHGSAGGGNGGGTNAGATALAGGVGGYNTMWSTAGAAAGTSAGGVTNLSTGGNGGGGGSNGVSSAGGDGGNGGNYGGGGGGGGSSNTTFLSGAGGAGAKGCLVVICYF